MKKKHMRLWVGIILTGITLIGFCGSTAAQPAGEVIIFHAGSLSVPLAEMEKRFEARYPSIDILREGGGSTKMARLISEVGKPADIMASADYLVIDKTLIPDHAAWNIRFATNQLVLCYTADSQYAGEITAGNWYDILGRKGVVWGHSDPNLDPCGYRSLMVLQLAEKFYNLPGLYDKLIDNRPAENVRPKSVELVSLLKTGNMDYAWEYLSVAVQHELKYLTLDDHLNLGNYRYDEFYAQAKVKVTGDDPGTFITRTGGSITYGVTLLNDAPNRDAAILFLEYLLDKDGGAEILQDMGQPPFVPARVPSEEMRKRLPAPLQGKVEVMH